MVEGDVIGDGSFFTGPLLAEGWDPGRLERLVRRSDVGSFVQRECGDTPSGAHRYGRQPEVLTLPEGADIPMRFAADWGRGRNRVQIGRTHPTEPLDVQGSIARGGRDVWRQMTVPDPPRYAASVLRHALTSAGIEVLGRVRTVSDGGASPVTARTVWAPAVRAQPDRPRIIASYQSPPLLEYLEIVNK